MLNTTIKAEQMTGRTGNPIPNQFKIRVTGQDDNKVIFQSYNSTILIIDFRTNTLTFGRDWDYSRTTSKYLHQFFNEELRENISCNEIRQALKEGTIETTWKTWTVKEG